MVNVTKKYQVTIPREVREDLNINQGDKVIFVKNSEGSWIIMTVEDLTSKMIESSTDVEKSIKSHKEIKKVEPGLIRI